MGKGKHFCWKFIVLLFYSCEETALSRHRMHLIGGLLIVWEGWSMNVMAGSRQAWHGDQWLRAWPPDPQAVRDSRPSLCFWNFKDHPQVHPYSNKVISPNPSKQFHLLGTKHLNKKAFGGAVILIHVTHSSTGTIAFYIVVTVHWVYRASKNHGSNKHIDDTCYQTAVFSFADKGL